uniref:Uncharacterized protein n=1 Tax=Arundo donax TaxID=35708 RepID=A0A0A8XUR7_ARUDO
MARGRQPLRLCDVICDLDGLEKPRRSIAPATNHFGLVNVSVALLLGAGKCRHCGA